MSSLADDRPFPSFSLQSSILTAFGNVAAAQRAGHEFERLNRLSDSQLARRGLTREDLAHEVLKRHMR